jgi:hypothetical protein
VVESLDGSIRWADHKVPIGEVRLVCVEGDETWTRLPDSDTPEARNADPPGDESPVPSRLVGDPEANPEPGEGPV